MVDQIIDTMELKEIYFKKRTRISGSAQRMSNYVFTVLFALLSPVFIIVALSESPMKMQSLLIGIGALLVLLALAYISYRAAMKMKRVEADEEKIYIMHSKVDTEEIVYAQITGGTRGWTIVTREFYVKLYYLDEDGVQQSFRFAPRVIGSHYDNFVDLLAQKNPNLKIRRRRV